MEAREGSAIDEALNIIAAAAAADVNSGTAAASAAAASAAAASAAAASAVAAAARCSSGPHERHWRCVDTGGRKRRRERLQAQGWDVGRVRAAGRHLEGVRRR